MTSDGKPNGVNQGLERSGRIRRSTLERFNDEMSVLDRPLENDVEYYDEVPPARWPKILGVGLALFVMSGAGVLVLTRPSAAEHPVLEISATSPAPAPMAAPAPPSVAAAPATDPAPLEAAAAAPAEAEEGDLEEVPLDAPPAAAVAPSAWSKIGSKAGRSSGHSTRTRVTAQRHKPRHR